jgi:flagellar biosynthesis protein
MTDYEQESGAPGIDLTDVPPVSSPQKIQKAVAVAYDKQSEDAPQIVASGKGAVAEQILSLAFAHGVRVREDAALVEILEALEVDSPIPLEAFAAVAEILSYVYRANEIYGKPSHNAAERNHP